MNDGRSFELQKIDLRDERFLEKQKILVISIYLNKRVVLTRFRCGHADDCGL